MIYTMTLNPSLDYYLKVDDFCEGMVNRAATEEIAPGGKGINVSIVLKNLGIKNTAMGFIGGFTGEEIERRLQEQGIDTDFVKLKNGNSRINIKLKSDKETEINAIGPQINDGDLEKLYNKLDVLCDGDVLVLAGSVPKGLQNSVYCNIMSQLSSKGVKFVVDAEKALLEKVLPYKPFLIKPNHHELGGLFGKELKTTEEIFQCAKILQQKGAQNVFVSMADEGGIFVSEEGRVMYSPAPKGKLINSTGAGDSAVAGFLAEFIKSKDYKKAFVMGLCAGSASAFSTDLATKAKTEELYSKIEKVIYMQ